MSAKINFKVVGCTGWEDGYSPKNVEVSHFGNCKNSEKLESRYVKNCAVGQE